MTLTAQDRADWTAAYKAMFAAVTALYASADIDAFVANVEALGSLVQETAGKKIRHGFSSGNGGLDVEIMSTVSRQIVALLSASAVPVTNKEISEKTGIPLQSVSLCTYYLRKIGTAIESKRGRSIAVTLSGKPIPKGEIEKVWISIQIAPFVETVVPDWFG